MISDDTAKWLFDTIDSVKWDQGHPDSKKHTAMRKKALMELAVLISKMPPLEEDSHYVWLVSDGGHHWNKVGCIKLVRELTGMGLKEAKDKVEGVLDDLGLNTFSIKCKAFQAEMFEALGCTVTKTLVAKEGTIPQVTEMVERACYLKFSEASTTVKVYGNEPPTGEGEVAMFVTAKIPKSLFSSIKLRAHLNVPEGPGVSEEMLLDLKNAVGMSYGKAVQLIVEPAESP